MKWFFSNDTCRNEIQLNIDTLDEKYKFCFLPAHKANQKLRKKHQAEALANIEVETWQSLRADASISVFD